MSDTNHNDESKESKPNAVAREERILKFWNENQIFKKSVEKDAPKGDFVFYDGPPFATGLPHFGHLVGGTIKDVVPRYKTMKGYRVPRKWGWDTHGLPIENLLEKELNLKTKKDIEDFGIDKFSQAAKNVVFRYDEIWKDLIPRTGRWVDMENPYVTMNPEYTESVWWMFKELNNKNYLSEGFKSMHLCPRCETTLSNFEVNQGYQDIVDISVTAKFELISPSTTLGASEKVYFLAWTTTPWTLPGNVGLAINLKTTYVKVKSEDSLFIVAKERIEDVFVDKTFEIQEEISADEIFGKSYKPLFDYYSSNPNLENRENGWKIYADDFVTTEEGTGIVHLAPAFGDEDYLLAKRENLPFVQHVNKDGTFKKEVRDFAGLKVKPKEDHQSTDIEIIKYLASKDLLFSKKKITHSYPHCWRCDTPLLNYASSSWFIDVPKFKDKLISENEKIKWVPESVGKNRFGNWLKDAREWAISRSRFWGAPIPVWKSKDGEDVAVLGSLSDLKEKTKNSGKIFAIRHGEAEHNVKRMLNDDDDVPSHVTENGKEQIKEKAKQLSKEKIDVIISSPLIRTKETSELLAESLGLNKSDIIFDERIRETNTGISNKDYDSYRNLFKNQREKFDKAHPGGETLTEMKQRVGDFLYEINEKYKDKNVLVVSHEYPIWMMYSVTEGLDKDATADLKKREEDFIDKAGLIDLDFAPIPHNDDYELDFHRPYIDRITFTQNGKEMKRVEEVFDVWIDSGSMPFASTHYPFEKKIDPKGGFLKKSIGYPADFIAEGIDQTRGWFYTLLVLNVALFGKTPYKTVVVNGQILAEDGKKMSKRLNNYPPLDHILDNYGADAMRFFLMASSATKAEDLNFSEKGVDEVMKKLLGRLDNVVTFYEMYSEDNVVAKSNSVNVLDKWIVTRLNEVITETTNSLENYEIDRAARPLMGFVDDLSTWYIRRSRDRFKESGEDKNLALGTTKYVLETFAKIIAPFIPFMAEDIYLRINKLSDFAQGKEESVHLANWPEAGKVDEDVLSEMEKLRDLVTKALEIRTNTGIKVRQPLAKLTLKDESLKDKDGLLEILKDELNVKEIVFDKSLSGSGELVLDTEITPELRAEGDARELIRAIQNLRKQSKLSPNDEIVLNLSYSLKDLVNKFEREISETAKVKEFNCEVEPRNGEKVVIDGKDGFISLK